MAERSRFRRRVIDVPALARLRPPRQNHGTAADDELLRFVATVELALAQLYDEARLLGHLDAASALVAERFAAHHRLHAQSLEAGASVGVSPANAAVLAEFSPQLRAARTHKATLAVLQRVEQAIAATQLVSLETLQYAASAASIAEILPVECQHAVALGTLLGQPLPELVTTVGAEPTTAGLDPSKYPAS